MIFTSSIVIIKLYCAYCVTQNIISFHNPFVTFLNTAAPKCYLGPQDTIIDFFFTVMAGVQIRNTYFFVNEYKVM